MKEMFRGIGEYAPIPIRIKETREYSRFTTTDWPIR